MAAYHKRSLIKWQIPHRHHQYRYGRRSVEMASIPRRPHSLYYCSLASLQCQDHCHNLDKQGHAHNLLDFLAKGIVITGAYYTSLQQKLWEAINLRGVGCWPKVFTSYKTTPLFTAFTLFRWKPDPVATALFLFLFIFLTLHRLTFTAFRFEVIFEGQTFPRWGINFWNKLLVSNAICRLQHITYRALPLYLYLSIYLNIYIYIYIQMYAFFSPFFLSLWAL